MQSHNHDKVILRIRSSAVQQGIRRALAHPTFSQGVPVAKKRFVFCSRAFTAPGDISM